MSVFGVVLVRIFPAFSRIRTEYGADTFNAVFLTVIIETIPAKLCLGYLFFDRNILKCARPRDLVTGNIASASFAKRLILNVRPVSSILLN